MTATHFACLRCPYTCIDWRKLIDHRLEAHSWSDYYLVKMPKEGARMP